MKTFWTLIIAVSAAIGLMLALPLLRGYVLIKTAGWSIEINVLILIVGVLLIIGTIKLAIWLWKLPGNTLRTFLEKRAAAQLELGMLALSQGDWRKAEKALKQSAKRKDQAALSYMGAAQAAQERGKTEQMQDYLDKADQSSAVHQPVQITRAQLLLSANQPTQALDVLNEIRKPRENRIKILELLAVCYQKLSMWPELQDLIPDLLKAGVIDQAQAEQLATQSAESRLSSLPEGLSVDQVWQSFDRRMQQHPRIVETYARHAIASDEHQMAEGVLRGHIQKDWQEPLVHLYAQLAHAEPAARAKQVKQWLKKHPDSASAHLAMGLIELQQNHTDQAHEHLQISAQLKPDSLTFRSLADLEMHEQHFEQAARHYRQALSYPQDEAMDNGTTRDQAVLNSPSPGGH